MVDNVGDILYHARCRAIIALAGFIGEGLMGVGVDGFGVAPRRAVKGRTGHGDLGNGELEDGGRRTVGMKAGEYIRLPLSSTETTDIRDTEEDDATSIPPFSATR